MPSSGGRRFLFALDEVVFMPSAVFFSALLFVAVRNRESVRLVLETNQPNRALPKSEPVRFDRRTVCFASGHCNFSQYAKGEHA